MGGDRGKAFSYEAGGKHTGFILQKKNVDGGRERGLAVKKKSRFTRDSLENKGA